MSSRAESLYQGAILDLERLGDKWEVVRHAAGVGILVRDGDLVLGVRQFRPALGRETWEIPAGLVDAGEEPVEAAARELAEEVQLGGELTLLARFYTSPGFTDEEAFVFELSAPRPASGALDEDERLTPEWRDAAETWQQVLSGALATSSITVMALAHVVGRPAGRGDERS